MASATAHQNLLNALYFPQLLAKQKINNSFSCPSAKLIGGSLLHQNDSTGFAAIQLHRDSQGPTEKMHLEYFKSINMGIQYT